MFNQFDSASQQRLAALKEAVVANFLEENWLDVGLKASSIDIVRNHRRLLNSLRFQNDDYGGSAFSVLLSIIDRDPRNLGIIEAYVEEKFGSGPGENISTATSRNRKIVFAPSVFEVPDVAQDSSLVAVMIPFAPQFEAVFAAIDQAASEVGLRCLRAKDIWEHSAVIQDVFSLIFRSQIVVCDFSTRNPNVFYEAGIAHALGKHVVPITQNEGDIPFDLRHHRYLTYLPNGEGLATLTKALAPRLGDLSPRSFAQF